MKIMGSIAVLVIVALAGCSPRPDPAAQVCCVSGIACQAITEQEVAALFDRWNAALQTGDPKQVVANYGPDLGTLSQELCRPATKRPEAHVGPTCATRRPVSSSGTADRWEPGIQRPALRADMRHTNIQYPTRNIQSTRGAKNEDSKVGGLRHPPVSRTWNLDIPCWILGVFPPWSLRQAGPRRQRGRLPGHRAGAPRAPAVQGVAVVGIHSWISIVYRLDTSTVTGCGNSHFQFTW
jgi:hypothetical protein